MFTNFLLLALQGTMHKKKRSLLVFLVLLISFSFVILSISLVSSIGKTNAEYRIRTYGEWYCAIPFGMDGDEAWLKKQSWAESVGVARNYGIIGTSSGTIAFGTLDQNMMKVGGIVLDDGRFPQSDNEIAMEADALSSLGYDYELGQEISLQISIPYEDEFLEVERKYFLCGIIHEYSNLWVLNRNAENQQLVSAVVSDDAAEEYLELVRNYSNELQYQVIAVPIPQLFVTVAEKDREQAVTAINEWLSQTRIGEKGDIHVCENVAAYPSTMSPEYGDQYGYMIAIITMIAVFCIYVIRMKDEIKSFLILRSIGITKKQMGVLLLLETMLLVMPAIVLGIPCGASLIWLALKFMMYSGSVPIQVAIPSGKLMIIIGLWVSAVLISRSVMFIITVNAPIVNQMQLKNAKARRMRRVRHALIVFLLSIFCFITIFTGMESIRPAYLREYWSLCPSYTIWEKGTVPISKMNLMKQAPGVARVDGFSELKVGLSFDDSREQIVTLYAIEEEGWKKSLDFRGIEESFSRGDLVIMCFPEDSEEEYPLPKSQITLKVYSKSGEMLTEAMSNVSIARVPERAFNRMLYAFWQPYTIFCSVSYLQTLLDSMKPGSKWDRYTIGEEFGYSRVYVSTDMNSDYLSTDVSMANLCKENGLTFDNRRQEFQAKEQENVQLLIFIYSAGICIALIAFLLLISVLSLETELEMRSFRILRAIGMSKRQIRRRVLRKALFRGLFSVCIGWGCYIVYLLLRYIRRGISFVNALELVGSTGTETNVALVLTAICLFLPLMISILTKRRFLEGDIVAWESFYR